MLLPLKSFLQKTKNFLTSNWKSLLVFILASALFSTAFFFLETTGTISIWLSIAVGTTIALYTWSLFYLFKFTRKYLDKFTAFALITLASALIWFLGALLTGSPFDEAALWIIVGALIPTTLYFTLFPFIALYKAPRFLKRVNTYYKKASVSLDLKLKGLAPKKAKNSKNSERFRKNHERRHKL